MSNTIINRMEKLLSGPCSKQKQTNARTGTVITCTRLRRLQQMQSELITMGSLTENHSDVMFGSIKELIAARIAQTEQTESTARNDDDYASTDINKTIVNLNAWSASIYFWSPYTAGINEKRKSKFMQGKLPGRSCLSNNDMEDNSGHRNKDAFINFSQPALIVMATNQETPVSTLKWLAAHHSADIRTAVAQNTNTDEETLALLAQDYSENVRSAVLDNARINKELAIKLANDQSLSVSTKARNVYYKLDMKSKKAASLPSQKTIDNGQDILKCEREFLKTVAESADPSQRIIVKSPRSADWHIRMLVAGDPNSTAEMLWQLSSHPISQIKRKLVDKYSCLLETVVNLTGPKKLGANSGLAASTTQTCTELTALSD